MFQRTQVKEGMTVRSIDGEKLGKVFAVGDEAFHIEKGLFFPKDYLVRYSEIADIRDGDIILTHGRESLLRSFTEERYRTTAAAPPAGPGIGRSREGRRTDEVAIPVHKEEMDISKREVQAGEVRVHKEVVEEMKTVTVPVREERVRVERRDVQPGQPATAASFQEETVVVPLHAEEVEVHKRPVVTEEVIIRKDATEEERRVAETLRREEVDVRTSGEAEDTRSLKLGPEDDPTQRRS